MTAQSAVAASVDGLLAPTVAETLAALEFSEADAATARMAERYAKVLDEAQDPRGAPGGSTRCS